MVARYGLPTLRRELMIILARMFAGLFTGGIFVSSDLYRKISQDPEDQGSHPDIQCNDQERGQPFWLHDRRILLGGSFPCVWRRS